MCYTYDSLNRVTARTIKTLSDEVISSESYTYDAAGNIIDAPDSCFTYDNNNRLTVFNGKSVSYDLDGNMLSDGNTEYEYDSANRLIKAGDHTYTYNAEDVRIRNLCSDADTTYTYNTNCKLSQLLTKTTHEITTKYVYGHGLIYQEKQERLKVFHYDYRGSTVAVTDDWSSVIITFKYDTYGNVIDRTGTTYLIFGYNGRDGVITDRNGLIYMRARYYSPEMRRFINADVLHGAISDSTSLNRYSYVNGNPVSFVDPFGMEKERGTSGSNLIEQITKWIMPKRFSETFAEAINRIISANGIQQEINTKIQQEQTKLIWDLINSAINWFDESVVQSVIGFFNDIYKDVNNFDWQNTDEQKVLRANLFSAYKETLVIKLPIGTNAFSFGIIFMGKDVNESIDVQHEYGHTEQLEQMGLFGYLDKVAIPSVIAYKLEKKGDLPYDYYTAPWEAEADIKGGVDQRKRKNSDPWTEDIGYYDIDYLIQVGYSHLKESLLGRLLPGGLLP